MPPSTSSDWPVMKSESDEARKRATPTRSSGREAGQQRTGGEAIERFVFLVRQAAVAEPLVDGLPHVGGDHAGQKALAVMPSLPKARAAAWVRATTANLLAE